jgi:hypothetical protein
MPAVAMSYAPSRPHSVTTLMAVGDEAAGAVPTKAKLDLRWGLMAMGAASLVGLSSRTARFAGAAGLLASLLVKR